MELATKHKELMLKFTVLAFYNAFHVFAFAILLGKLDYFFLQRYVPVYAWSEKNHLLLLYLFNSFILHIFFYSRGYSINAETNEMTKTLMINWVFAFVLYSYLIIETMERVLNLL